MDCYLLNNNKNAMKLGKIDMIRKILAAILSSMAFVSNASAQEAADIKENYRIARAAASSACRAIVRPMNNIAVLAGISTVSSGVGTIAAGTALATGIAKTGTDKKVEQRKLALDRLKELNKSDDEALIKAAQDGTVLDALEDAAAGDLNGEIAEHEQQLKDDIKTSASFGTARAVGSFVAGGTSAVASGTAFAGAFAVDYDK
ncbi:MAG: hypothetical protein LBT92_03550, partial [Rickettsiales bacterium]|nr:hypothetical protein [Rickettsiales bacterium]